MCGESAFLAANELRLIGARAATIHERLAIAAELPPEERSAKIDEAAERALEAWGRAYAPGDPEAFQRRLGWDGVDPSLATVALSESVLRGLETPAWTSWLCSFLEESAILAQSVELGESIEELDEYPVSGGAPFPELWVPVVRVARHKLADARPHLRQRVRAVAHRALEVQLLRELGAQAELAVFETFKEFRSRNGATVGTAVAAGDREDSIYRAFVLAMLGGGLKELFLAYPVLSCHLALLAESWVSGTRDMLERLARDRGAVAETFGQGEDLGDLVEVETGLSDPHNGGRRVAILGFESGLRVVYKPRPVGLERAYNEVLVWARDRGLKAAPRALQVIERDGYGWADFVARGSPTTKRATRDYFRRAGALLCFAWILRGKDLHMENVIAAGESPVVIDAEMLAQPVTAPSAHDVGKPADRRLIEESCLSTGLLTVLEPHPVGGVHDVGGLRGRGGGMSPLAKRVWKRLGTDALDFEVTKIFSPPLNNQVFVDGKVQLPEEFAGDVTAGFSEAYDFFLRHRQAILAPGGPIDRFVGSPVRVLFRPTTQYAAMLYVLASPRYQRSGTTRSFALDTLNRVFSGEQSKPLLWPLVSAERRALECLDIPPFVVAADGTDVAIGEGRDIQGYFERSGLAAIVERINALSTSDLHQQLKFLSWALSNTSDARFATPMPAARVNGATADLPKPAALPTAGPANVVGSEMVAYALWIAEEMLARSQQTPGNVLTWPAAPWHQCDGPGDLRELNLYSGCSGPALFFAGLYVVDGDTRWQQAAAAAARPLLLAVENGDPRLQDAAIGACEGVGSLVWALTWLGRLLRDPSYTVAARRVAEGISLERIASDSNLDVIAGTAGAVLALLAIHNDVPDHALLRAATAAGRHLLARSVSTDNGGVAWPVQGVLLAGFAHGAAGIGYALARLAGVADCEEFLDTSAKAFRFEASLFSPQRGNWRIARAGPRRSTGGAEWMMAWCHGAPGAALARSLSLDMLRNNEIIGEIETAVETTSRYTGGRWDHLCCGALGRSDAMLTAGLVLDTSEFMANAERVATGVCERARENGRFSLPSSDFECRVFMPGFFHGLSGIGYQLLRTAAPSRLPSVLGLET